jgi:hypothetical protein
MGAEGTRCRNFPKLMFHLPSSRLSYDDDNDDNSHDDADDDDDNGDDDDDDDDNESASSRLQRVIGHRSIATQPLSFIKLQFVFNVFFLVNVLF